MPFQHVHLIVNPASGQPRPVLYAVNHVLYEAGIDWNISVTTARHDATALTREAVAAGADLIVAYGGDGTVKSVINGLIDTQVPLALLPGGTGNAMAHELAIPTDLQEAAQLIVGEHRLRPIDVGKVTLDNDPDQVGHFILRSSIGLQNRMLEEATPELKRQFGNLAYIAAGLKAYSQREKMTFQLTIDGQKVEKDGLTCLIANSASLGGDINLLFAPDVAPDNGTLDVFILDSDLESLLSMVNSSIEADLDQYPNHWRGKEIHVSLDQESPVTIDGEPFGETPITAAVLHHAVQVLVRV